MITQGGRRPDRGGGGVRGRGQHAELAPRRSAVRGGTRGGCAAVEPDAAAAEVLLADLVQDRQPDGPGALMATGQCFSAQHHTRRWSLRNRKGASTRNSGWALSSWRWSRGLRRIWVVLQGLAHPAAQAVLWIWHCGRYQTGGTGRTEIRGVARLAAMDMPRRRLGNTQRDCENQSDEAVSMHAAACECPCSLPGCFWQGFHMVCWTEPMRSFSVVCSGSGRSRSLHCCIACSKARLAAGLLPL